MKYFIINKKNLLIFVFICITVFSFFYYIFLKFGNNNNKGKIVDEILNSFNVYEADIEVTVYSNKNTNIYNMHQIVNHKISKSIVEKPKEINGLVLELNEEKLQIKNEKYNMEKVYDNYLEILNNSLFLNTFTNNCKNNGFNTEEADNKIIIKTKLNNNKNTYIKYKELYVYKGTNIPMQLIIKDNKQNIYTSIKYNNVKIK